MYCFDKLVTLLQHAEEPEIPPDTFEFWKRVSAVSKLCLADTLEEAKKAGFNSVDIKVIEALFESTWAITTMEETCDEEEADNFYTPFGEYVAMNELADLLLSTYAQNSGETLF